MKLCLLAFFVVAAVAIPVPDHENNGNIDVIVNGVPEGEALDIDHIIGIHTQEKVNGELVATTNVLHPFTAVGIAEATAAAAEAELAAEESVISPVINPEPQLIETVVIPKPIVLPEAVAPEVVENVVPEIVETIPAPVVLPEPISPVVVPEPVLPEAPIVVPEVATPVEVVDAIAVAPEAPATPIEVVDAVAVAPESPVEVVEAIAVPQPVEAVPEPALQTGEIFNNGVVSVAVNSQEPSLLTTLQSWFNMVVNYVTNGVQTQTTQIV